jgi:hypothetical protein
VTTTTFHIVAIVVQVGYADRDAGPSHVVLGVGMSARTSLCGLLVSSYGVVLTDTPIKAWPPLRLPLCGHCRTAYETRSGDTPEP